ncbi:hypothetical protein L7F22_020020 [Adiantum nelumboides]|nr:hypothetical protein [Adiantum nelumboides]
MSEYFVTRRCKAMFGCTVAVKGVISTTGRDINYTTQIWNVHRSFIKCGCEHVDQGEFCRDNNVLWFDHALWLILHQLPSFFPIPSLKKSTIAFLGWVAKEAQEVSKALLVHFFYRQKLKEAISHSVLFNQAPPTYNPNSEVDGFIQAAVFARKTPQEARPHKKARGNGGQGGRGHGRNHTPQRTYSSSNRWVASSPTISSRSSRSPFPTPTFPPHSTQLPPASLPTAQPTRSEIAANPNCLTSAKALLYD